MSHTDRDDKKYRYKHHHDGENCTRWIRATERSWPRIEQWCECLDWFDYQHAKFWPTPSGYKTDLRREERAQARSYMERGDYDNIPRYRRPYYW